MQPLQLQQFRAQQSTVHYGMIECRWCLALTLAHPPCCHLLVKGLQLVPDTCSCRVQARRTSRRFTVARCALSMLRLRSDLAWQLLESVAQAATFRSKVCPHDDSAPAFHHALTWRCMPRSSHVTMPLATMVSRCRQLVQGKEVLRLCLTGLLRSATAPSLHHPCAPPAVTTRALEPQDPQYPQQQPSPPR